MKLHGDNLCSRGGNLSGVDLSEKTAGKAASGTDICNSHDISSAIADLASQTVAVQLFKNNSKISLCSVNDGPPFVLGRGGICCRAAGVVGSRHVRDPRATERQHPSSRALQETPARQGKLSRVCSGPDRWVHYGRKSGQQGRNQEDAGGQTSVVSAPRRESVHESIAEIRPAWVNGPNCRPRCGVISRSNCHATATADATAAPMVLVALRITQF